MAMSTLGSSYAAVDNQQSAETNVGSALNNNTTDNQNPVEIVEINQTLIQDVQDTSDVSGTKGDSTTKTQQNQNTAQNTSNITSNVKNSLSTGTKTQNAVQTAVDNKQDSTSTAAKTVNNTGAQEGAAAGTTKTALTSINFNLSQIKDAAAKIKSYIETNHKLPNYVTIGTTQVEMPEFLKLMVAGLLQINNKTTTSITLKDVGSASKPTESVKSGNLTKASYLDLAKRVNAFINANGVLPNYASSSLGKLNYESLIYSFSKILAFYKTNGRLPGYVTVKPWSTVGTSSSNSTSSPVPASLQQYLKATTNCQVNNTSIKSLVASITSGKSSTYDKAVAIFNWVRDKIGYSFYYNTKYGAVGTLNAKTGNCVDTAHLLIALERAAGIPARYEHVKAQFTSGTWYGHVIAQVWVGGKWYNADATSSSNTFGVIKNWNTATATYYGTYATLPF